MNRKESNCPDFCSFFLGSGIDQFIINIFPGNLDKSTTLAMTTSNSNNNDPTTTSSLSSSTTTTTTTTTTATTKTAGLGG